VREPYLGWLISVALGLVVNEIWDLTSCVAKLIAKWAGRFWTRDKIEAAGYAEEFQAYVEERPGKLLRLCTALGLFGFAIFRHFLGWTTDGEGGLLARGRQVAAAVGGNPALVLLPAIVVEASLFFLVSAGVWRDRLLVPAAIGGFFVVLGYVPMFLEDFAERRGRKALEGELDEAPARPMSAPTVATEQVTIGSPMVRPYVFATGVARHADAPGATGLVRPYVPHP
jgi:hypothetical protein